MTTQFRRRVLVLCLIFVLAFQTLFGGDPAAENRSAVLQVLKNMASRAQEHYFLPASLGGGNGSFSGAEGGVSIAAISQITAWPTTGIGTFSLGTVTATYLNIEGEGTAMGDDGNLISVEVGVFADSIYVTFNN